MISCLYRALRLGWPGGLETRRHLRELEHSQWLSRSELEAWQLEQIQRLVKVAYEHVPFYRERYQGAGIHPDDIHSFEDFQALPFLTRDDVNTHRDQLLAPQFRGRVRIESTGGSTGEPVQFFVDKSFWWWNAALEFRGRGWYGAREGERMAWIWGAARDLPEQGAGVRLKARVMRQRYLNAFAMTEAKMQAFTELLQRWQPAMIRAYPAALALYAQFLKERSIAGIRPKLIETVSEKLTEPQRRLFDEVFGCPVADCYASRELGTMAYQCPEGGRHVSETVHLEIVAKRQVVSPGQLGEVVVTSLHQLAMPFIRYKNGDLGVQEGGTCSCGRDMPLLCEVVGRKQDFVVSADGQYVLGGFFALHFQDRPEIARYQVYQPDRQHLEVRLVCRQTVDQAWLDTIRDGIQTHLGQAMQISLKVVDRIELTPAGKHRIVISDVMPDFAA